MNRHLPRGTRVVARGGPYELPCGGCGKPFGDTAPSITGTIWSGPTSILFRCAPRPGGGCGHQEISHGWYRIAADDPPGMQAVPWHLVEPLEEASR